MILALRVWVVELALPAGRWDRLSGVSEKQGPIRVGVLGARGRMGQQVCRTVEGAPDMELAATVDVGDPLDALVEAGVDVVVDFTTPDAVLDNLRWCVRHGLNVVAGTSGFTPERLDEIKGMLAGTDQVGVLVVPNFAIGAVLMMEFAARAAKYFESVEIIELHHPKKVDAPSGTALGTAAMIAEARQAAGLASPPDATTDELAGARGASVSGIRVHSVRSTGLVAHQEVLFGGDGQSLTIRHDSFDRSSFMPGVLMAVRGVVTRPGLTVGLGQLLAE